MTLWDHLCCFGYGIQARMDGLWHLVRGHNLHWRDSPEPWIGCFGSILCEECPDTNGCGLLIWTRHSQIINWITQRLCGLIGHPVFRHPQCLDETNTEVQIKDELYCQRCGGHSKINSEMFKRLEEEE